MTLSEKGKVARFFDKTKDAAEVVKLVEKLGRAITIYQVGARDVESRELLILGTDVAKSVNTQPGVPINREFRPFHLRVRS